MPAQDAVGWLVPAWLIAASAAALVADVVRGTYSQMWIPFGGLVLGAALAVGLERRRREWTRSREGAARSR